MDINALIQMMAGGGGGAPPADPRNQQVPGMPPLPQEDSETNGYWDAQNRGNGRGNSFQMQGGKQIPADPVGLPPEIAQLMEMIGPAGGQGQDIAGQVQQAVGVPIPPQVLQYMIDEGWTPEEMIEILAKEVQETGKVADSPLPE